MVEVGRWVACPTSIAVEPVLSYRSVNKFDFYRNGDCCLYSYMWQSKNDPLIFISVKKNSEAVCYSKPNEISTLLKGMCVMTI